MTKAAVCQSLVRPRFIEAVSSKGDGRYYEVISETMFNDPICDCPGFQYRGHCRHVVETHSCAFNRRLTPGEYNLAHGTELGKCPNCDQPMIVYNFTPEYV